ncbi:MAG: hypothetical protein EAZ61_13515, partial [Oscillatoriales cyanobacterium]
MQQFNPKPKRDPHDLIDPDRVSPIRSRFSTSRPWGRRRFGRYLGLVLGSTIASALGLLKTRATRPSRRAILPIAISDTVRSQVNTLLKQVQPSLPETELLIPTYLGNPQRRFYGRGLPQRLQALHRFDLGSGISIVGGTA